MAAAGSTRTSRSGMTSWPGMCTGARRPSERPSLGLDGVRALAGAIRPRFECLVRTAAASGPRFGKLAGLAIEHVNLQCR